MHVKNARLCTLTGRRLCTSEALACARWPGWNARWMAWNAGKVSLFGLPSPTLCGECVCGLRGRLVKWRFLGSKSAEIVCVDGVECR